MGGKKNGSKNNLTRKEKKPEARLLPPSVRGYLLSLVFLLLSLIILLSFFGLAGAGGEEIFSFLSFLFGRAVFVAPLLSFIAAVILFMGAHFSSRIWPLAGLAFLLSLLGPASILASFGFEGKILLRDLGSGGLAGRIFSFPVLKIFGFWVNFLFFGCLTAFGFIIFWYLGRKVQPQATEDLTEKPQILKRIFETKLKVKEVTPSDRSPSFSREESKAVLPELKTKPILQGRSQQAYQKPSFDLLEPDRGTPTTGDIRNNLAVIKKTLETFDIPVEMGEVNIGPTVTQYTLKPSEGIKLSKITTLSNDLSLALAMHPIRIEAPIPGKPLVGIELPNKTRTQVRMRNLLEMPEFHQSQSPLLLALGRDVAGNASFSDLSRMPHMLVAGSTGSGKTICLNTIILSLIYRNSPDILKLILVDPKRVEFPVYQDLPHLLSPVIFDAHKTVTALKWLTKEMERRFEVLSQARARDIASYNRDIMNRNVKLSKDEEEQELMPFIVVIIDELADLMASRGKEIEAGIVRLAQMARAVGIHLIVATQRPSVEVITGLIKANITSRVTFQVASQVDSRTVIDMAGAEKLLGAGDLLFVSSETAKPRRLQGAYVTDKEVRKVVEFLKPKEGAAEKENFLAEELERELEVQPGEMSAEQYLADEDPLYLSAKQLVIESKKASASLLQRRLRVGYARAARLLDILQERGVVGPGEGAKPREVYLQGESSGQEIQINTGEEEKKDDDWNKV